MISVPVICVCIGFVRVVVYLIMANTKDSVRELASQPQYRIFIGQDQAKRIPQEVIDISTKRDHHINKLAFTRKCMNQKIAFNKIEDTT